MRRLVRFSLFACVSTGCLPDEITVINDMHVDAETQQVTVYAQSRHGDEVLSPPQVGPGECTRQGLSTVCFHPNAVYLDGSGEELDADKGTGAWWVKHSWVLGGEGYENCEMQPEKDYDDCLWVEGVLLEDELTMQVGNDAFFNRRRPLLDEDPVRYEVVRYGPPESAPDAAPEAQFTLTFDCLDEASAFDGRARPCPDGTFQGAASHDGYWVTTLDPSEM